MCPLCALPCTDSSTCGACLKKPPEFDETRAAFSYAFPIDRMIQALKYQHRLHLARYFAQALAGLVPTDADVIVPMPLHPGRLRERGFNQAVEIARRLPRKVSMSLDVVVRERNTPPQATLPWKERHRSVRGAFRCVADLAGRHVVVIDDVMTTGASLNELARALKARAATRVTNLVVARTLLP
jgi:ComF family protein